MKEQDIFYSGNIKNPPVIFVHGFPYDHSMWDAQVNNLKNEFYCVTYDIRGLGKSPSEGGQFTIEDLSEDLISLASSMKYKPVVCGLSMGGYIALRAFEKDETKFKGLVLLDTKSIADNDETKLKRANAISSITKNGVEQYVKSFIPTCFSQRFMNDCRDLYEGIINNSMTFDPVGVKGCILAMACRTDTTAVLGKIDVPVLVLCGEEDKLCPPDDMKKMAELIRNSEFQIIKDAAHMTPIENPDRVNYLIKAFLHKIT